MTKTPVGPIRVAVVNDFELIVRRIEALLQPYSDRLTVTELDVGDNPDRPVDIALFDTYGHPWGGIDRVHSLALEPHVGAVAVYSWHVAPEQVEIVLAAGAQGVLAKSAGAEALADALVRIAAGEVVVSLAFDGRRDPPWPGHELGLTLRESEVAALLARGLSNREIAATLFISEHTVKTHLKAIFRKAGVTSRTRAIARIRDDTGFRLRSSG